MWPIDAWAHDVNGDGTGAVVLVYPMAEAPFFEGSKAWVVRGIAGQKPGAMSVHVEHGSFRDALLSVGGVVADLVGGAS